MDDKKLEFFQDLALSCLSLWSWRYTKDFRLQESNCPMDGEVNAAFLKQAGIVSTLYEKNLMPAVITAENGLAWAVTAQKASSQAPEYLVLGPARLEGAEIPAEEQPDFYAFLPLTSRKELGRYGSMLHKAAVDEITPVYQQEAEASPVGDTTAILLLASLQDKIRNGDLSYRELMSEALTNRRFLQSLGAVTTDSAKKVSLLAIELCCQAALESGLPKRSVDALRIQYSPQLDGVTSAYEIARLCDTLMYHLVLLIRRYKGEKTYSEPVQTCCTYVNEHICDRLTVEFLAKQTGYSPDHLSKKFREEFGEPLKDYILHTKIQRSQLLLTTTTMPVSDIATMFSFSSSSHFTKVFEHFTNETPTAYRTQHSHLV